MIKATFRERKGGGDDPRDDVRVRRREFIKTSRAKRDCRS